MNIVLLEEAGHGRGHVGSQIVPNQNFHLVGGQHGDKGQEHVCEPLGELLQIKVSTLAG